MRSGTTICGHMIAEDTDKRYLDDLRDGMCSFNRVHAMVESGDNLVIQSPHVSWRIIELGQCNDVAVVFMHRDRDQIMSSIERRTMMTRLDRPAEYQHCDYVATKYKLWELDKVQIAHFFDVHYCDLSAHRLWVAPELRLTNWFGKTYQLGQIQHG